MLPYKEMERSSGGGATGTTDTLLLRSKLAWLTRKGAGPTRECCLDFIKREEAKCTAERESGRKWRSAARGMEKNWRRKSDVAGGVDMRWNNLTTGVFFFFIVALLHTLGVNVSPAVCGLCNTITESDFERGDAHNSPQSMPLRRRKGSRS